MENTCIFCPVCRDNQLVLKYEATYEYSYILDGNAPGLSNDKQLRPYCYDNRLQKEARQSIECLHCGAVFPCYFESLQNGLDPANIQAALNAAYQESLENR